METTRVAELLRPFINEAELSPALLTQLQVYLELLLRWNARMNLTAVRNPEKILTRHFGESLFAAQVLLGAGGGLALLRGPGRKKTSRVAAAWIEPGAQAPGQAESAAEPRSGGTVLHTAPENPLHPEESSVTPTLRTTLADVGSGAGFPGIPMKLFAPEVALTLIESQHKKATFLREVVRTLGLERAEVFSGRAEQWDKTADVVTLRAVEQFERALPAAAKLVAAGGRLCLLIGAGQIPTAQEILGPGWNWKEPELVPRSSGRVVLISTLSP